MAETTWAKFYWSDWESDPKLKMCSPAAQALWMRMLCICAQAEGYLRLGDQNLTALDMAQATGWPVDDVRSWWAELQRWEVFSVERRGCIYSRRMVRDHQRSVVGRETGKKGGNPSLGKDRENSRTLKAPSGSNQNPEKESPKPSTEGFDLLDLFEDDISLEAGDEQTKRAPPGSRNEGTNPRANGTNPRAVGDNPRAVQEAFDLWNVTAERCELPRAQDLTDTRRRSIGKRLERGGLERWRAALHAVERSKFLRGLIRPRGADEKPFRADLDFVCQARSFQRLVEGFYGQDIAPPAGQVVVITENDRWRRWVGEYSRNGYWDEMRHGPRPGYAGCKAPEEIMAEFGIALGWRPPLPVQR